MHRFVVPFALTAVFLLSRALDAQPLPSQAQAVALHEIKVDPDLLDRWEGLFLNGQWTDLQQEIPRVLTVDPEAVSKRDGERSKELLPPHRFDFAQNFYRVLFISKKRNPEGEILQLLVHSPSTEPYVQRLPGIEDLYDVYLTTNPNATRSSSYVTNPVANPLAEKIVGFVKLIDLGQVARFDRFQGLGTGDAAPPSLFVHINKVKLPRRRATIVVTDAITEPASLNSEKLITNSEELLQDILLREARGSACAQTLADCLDAALHRVVRLGCPPLPVLSPDEQIECGSGDGDGVNRCQLAKLLKKTYAAVVGTDPKCIPGSRIDFSPEIAVEKAFTSLVAAPKPLQIRKDSTYENVPIDHLSLGLISSLMLSDSGDPRVKLAENKVTADPLSGAMNLAVLNIHLFGFDPKSAKPSLGERFRLFIGPVISPEFGLAVGAGFAFIRGLSLNVGYARIRITTTKRGDVLGGAPGSLQDPFRDGERDILFAGFGYNF